MKLVIFSEHSLVTRIGGAIAAIALMATLGMAVSGMVALSTQGSGEAINLAGSLRMQSWQMTSYFLALRERDDPGARRHLAEAINRFDSTLNSPSLLTLLPGSSESNLASSYGIVKQTWLTRIRPKMLATVEQKVVSPNGEETRATLAEVDAFVGHIDHLVQQMAQATEAKIMVMSIVLGVALVITVLVVLLTIYLIHTGMVMPLRALLDVTTKAGNGNLAVRTDYTGEDELGRLGQSFNRMTEELAKLYQNLEARVEQKTAELSRSNLSLELLYHSIARLHGSPPERAIYDAVLKDIETVLGLGHGIICLGTPGGNNGRPVASTLIPGDVNPCDTGECTWCHSTASPRLSVMGSGRQLLTLPLSDSERQYGVLIIEAQEGQHPESWQVQLLEALSRHIGVAIGAEQRGEQTRKLALLEERAVIARELHDSLAQSLAYMKIQVSRLQTALNNPERSKEMPVMLSELREGLSGAYRQLRELLTTFRLRMEEENLQAVLQHTIEEFSNRGRIQIDLKSEFTRCPMSPNEEIHVLHVVREALSNVVNHAQATAATVSMGCDRDGALEIVIEDNGVGILKSADVHHYGMTIMEERARTLNGTIRYEPRPGGGTRVVLRFMPTSQKTMPLIRKTLP